MRGTFSIFKNVDLKFLISRVIITFGSTANLFFIGVSFLLSYIATSYPFLGLTSFLKYFVVTD